MRGPNVQDNNCIGVDKASVSGDVMERITTAMDLFFEK